MRVDAFPAHATLVPGQPLVVTVQVFNTNPVISAHTIRVFGVDPSWVTLDQDQLSLFPDTIGVIVATITLPKGIPAGTRQLTIQVNELTPPEEVETAVVDLTVPDEQGARIGLEPLSVTAGSKATVTVLLENEGNTDLNLRLEGIDEEDKIAFEFDPQVVDLAPGERVAANATLTARRPFAGTPKARTYTLRALGTDPPMETFGAFIQKPRLSRGALSMLGLLAAITVFAAVITVTLGRVVDKSTKDRDLLLQVINGQNAAGVTNPATISGKVTLLTSGAGVGGVTVEAFQSANTSSALTTTATATDGSYTLKGLPAGSYKLRFSGAGFTQIWYPSALTPDNAKEVAVTGGQAAQGIDIRLGGVPGKIMGTVSADVPTDAAGATVALSLPGTTPSTATSSSAAPALQAQTTPTSVVPAGNISGPTASNPLVATAAVGGDGSFTLDSVPSPSTYDLTVSKSGFATEVQQVNLAAGEERAGVDIVLRKGDGLISGHVVDANGPVGGVTVTASDGKSLSGTVSLTQDDVGAFTLRNLPTPATFTVLFSKSGFTTQTLSLTLASAQQLTGVVATLSGGSGSVSGQVTFAQGGQPAGGVSVIVTNGALTLQSATLSVDPVGTYRISGLPIPGTYTITFAGAGLASVTQAFDADSFGQPNVVVNASMPPSAGSVAGRISSQSNPAIGVGEVGVALSNGTSTFHTVTASGPSGMEGRYQFTGVPPGTYTLTFSRVGAATVSFIEGVTVDQPVVQDALIGDPAIVKGIVYRASDDTPLGGAQVKIYVLSQYPAVVSQTLTTGSDGVFQFNGLVAPESYIVEYSFPVGAPAQATRLVNNPPLQPGETRDISGNDPAHPAPHIQLTTG
ncbi:MAG TPA: carboxypeptidase-like regulatory domain-containing protein [Acidimicrobiales bacterium]|jgi:hypothetical protein